MHKIFKSNRLIFILLICIAIIQVSLITEEKEANGKAYKANKESRLQGKRIILPENLIQSMTGESLKSEKVFGYGIKILVLLDTGCFKCIEDMHHWQNFIDSFNKRESINFIFVVQAPTRNYIVYLLNKFKIRIPVLYDSTKFITTVNKISAPNVIVLDNSNTVITQAVSPSTKVARDELLKKLEMVMERN